MPDRPAAALACLLDRRPAVMEADTTASGTVVRAYGPVSELGSAFGCISAAEFGAMLDGTRYAQNLTVHLNSPGGDAFEGIAIMNQLRQHPAEVEVIVDSLAASAASVICMGADVVTMCPGSQMMVHDAAGLAMGFAADMETMRAFLESLSQNVADQYAAKAGGTAEQWRAAMQPESWYTAKEAVTAGLADRVLDPKDAPAKASMSFDLSGFKHAGRSDAPAPVMPQQSKTGLNLGAVVAHLRLDTSTTPADQPVTPPTDHKEDATMADTIPTAGLVKALGLPDDADEDTILEALDEKVKASTAAPTADAAAAALAADGKVVVSQAMLDTLKAGADAGQAALDRQRREDRDNAISAAQDAGKLGRAEDTVKAWQAAWDRDPSGTAAELADLAVRFPVAKTPSGYAGGDDAKPSEVFTEEQAKEQAAMLGIDYRELMSA